MTEQNKNMRIWDDLGVTDPSQTKGFKRSGGYSGTAIRPMWSFKRMTERFGPCGISWGPTEPFFQVVQADGDIMVYCTAGIWYIESDTTHISKTVYGVGGDKVVTQIFEKDKSGNKVRDEATGRFKTYSQSSDEAFKAAYTDALSNAMKLIGVGADVHMGLFDDSKYLREAASAFDGEGNRFPVENKADKPKLISKAKADSLRTLVKDRKLETEAVVNALKEMGYKNFGEVTEDRFEDVKAVMEGI